MSSRSKRHPPSPEPEGSAPSASGEGGGAHRGEPTAVEPSADLGAPPLELLRFVFESAEEAFWAWDPRRQTAYVSPRCYTLMGTDPELVPPTYESFVSMLHPGDAAAALEEIQRTVAKGEERFTFEFRLRDASGGWRRLLCRGATVGRDEAGGATSMVGSLVDVTKSRETEEALVGSEERYRTLVESQGEGIGIVDAEERFLFANPAAERIFGVAHGGLVGRSLREFLDDEQYGRILEQTGRRRSGRRDTYEVDLGQRGDERRTILVTATRRTDEDGQYAGAFGVFRDITDRKRAERAVRESEERYRQLIESLPHGVGVVTREEIKFVNTAAVRILGFGDRDELIGAGPLRFLAPGEAEHVQERLAGLAAGEVDGPVHYFARGLRQDGTEVPLEVFVTLVTYEGAPAYQVFMMDISEREEADRRRAHLEEELRQAHKMESIGRLAGGIAHDFNNMLAPILSLSEAAQADAEPGSQLWEDLQTIAESAERARDLTQQLLAFGRKQLLRMRVLSLNRIVEESHAMLRRLIPEHVAIEIELGEELGAVRADVSQLQQILMNLALNARDSMPEGGTMVIRTASATFDEGDEARPAALEPGAYVLLEVRDDGCGMDSETASHIFEPFFSTKGKGLGTGLGLATVHGIVKQHGGNIEVESEPGRGTTFRIYLPRVQAAEDEVESQAWERERQAGEVVVLVAEDDAAVRRSACRILRQQGFQVLEARDGEEALFHARRHQGRLDVVLSDVIMPRMNGQELAQRLAVLRPETPVVFMSGYTDDAIAHTGVLEEGVLFVQKPFSVRGLMKKIEEALGSRPKDGGSDAPAGRGSRPAGL